MPQFFKRYQKDLESAVLPALPNANTGLLTKYNGTNWVHTSLQILQEHYERVKGEVKESIRRLEVREWERAVEVASRWVRRDVRGIRDGEIRRGKEQLTALVREMRGQADEQDEEETSSRGSSLLQEDEDAMSVSSVGSSKRKAGRQDPSDTGEERGEGSRSWRGKGGDANVGRMAPIVDPRVQIDCFPLASMDHATHILRYKTPESDIDGVPHPGEEEEGEEEGEERQQKRKMAVEGQGEWMGPGSNKEYLHKTGLLRFNCPPLAFKSSFDLRREKNVLGDPPQSPGGQLTVCKDEGSASPKARASARRDVSDKYEPSSGKGTVNWSAGPIGIISIGMDFK
ncbi:uncharacterized protein V6R79_015993, partial [Siganus canaliculatus]